LELSGGLTGCDTRPPTRISGGKGLTLGAENCSVFFNTRLPIHFGEIALRILIRDRFYGVYRFISGFYGFLIRVTVFTGISLPTLVYGLCPGPIHFGVYGFYIRVPSHLIYGLCPGPINSEFTRLALWGTLKIQK
jgi:hypothetical protein